MAERLQPVLLLDVDDVFKTINEAPPAGAEQFAESPYEFYYPEHGKWLRPVLPRFDTYWLTANSQINCDQLSDRLGLEHYPRLAYEGRTRDYPERLQVAHDLFRDRPLAWIDDFHGEMERRWATRRNRTEAPTLLLKPFENVGLREFHVNELQRWLGSLPIAARIE